MTTMTSVICKYCGVGHAQSQSHCIGCGGELPPAETIEAPRRKRRDMIAAAVGVAILVTAVLVLSNKLSGPQQVEIVGVSPGASASAGIDQALQIPQFEPGSVEHRHLMNAHFAGAYVAISSLRMLLLQFRQMEGSYPDDFSQVGVDEEQLVDGQYITGVDLLEGGVLRAHLESGVFGEGAAIVLKPVDVMSGMQTRWLCSTTVPNDARMPVAGNMDCPYDAEIVN